MWDSFYSIFKISLKAIFANKMRAALTSLGNVSRRLRGAKERVGQRFPLWHEYFVFTPTLGFGRKYLLPQRRNHG